MYSLKLKQEIEIAIKINGRKFLRENEFKNFKLIFFQTFKNGEFYDFVFAILFGYRS